MPKYKSAVLPLPNYACETPENSTAGTAGPQDTEINKLRVNLFSRWGDDSSKAEENRTEKAERSGDVVVNYSTRDMSPEYPMMDSSTTHIEY